MANPIDARMIVQALPMPALVLDPDDVVLAANTLGIGTFTREPLRITGRNFKDVAADTWRAPLAAAVGRAKRDGRLHVISVVVPAAEADAGPWDVWMQPIQGDRASIAGVLITADDGRTSERLWSAELQTANAELQAANEELEGRLEELQTARRLDDERNRFLAMLAHELRNPLTGITNALYLLRRRRVTGADRLADQALRIAERQSKSQARLLDDLLDASRIVLGKITAHRADRHRGHRAPGD